MFVIENILIVGGSSGLGLELAKIYSVLGHNVFITGRKNPEITKLNFFYFSITQNMDELIKQINEILSKIEKINMLIYAAGFNQEGQIDKLHDNQILRND